MHNNLIIYGGSFNPPTKAHKLIYNILTSYNDCRVYACPTLDHAFDKELKPIEDRCRLLNKCNMSTLPMGRYMYDFVKRFKDMDYEVEIVIGSDCLKELHRWKDYEKLINNYQFCVVMRNEDDSKHLTQLKRYSIISKCLIDDIPNICSSTEVRSRVLNKIDISDLVPEEIIEEVEKMYES